MQSTKRLYCCIRQRDKSRSVSHVGGHSQGLPTIRHDLVDHALHAVDVSGLALREFGGGMTQLMRIEVLDRSEEQLDRVSFEFVEREYQLLRFVCANASVE